MAKAPEILFDCDEQSLSYFEKKFQGIDEQGVKGITLLVASQYPHSAEEMNSFLKKIPVPISGGVFPEVIHNSQYYSDAIIALLWFDDISIHTFEGVSQSNSSLYQYQATISDNAGNTTSLVFSSAKTRESEATLDALYYRNGQITQYAGAGSAYCGGCNDPSLISNNGLIADAIQIVCLPFEQVTRVRHGWSVLSGPHLVTESDKNRVKTLDYQPIKPYFESLIRESMAIDMLGLSLEKMLEQHPVGIQPYDEDMVVRDILRYNSETLEFEFIGDIPEYSNIYILSGEKESLLNYVKENAEQLNASASNEISLSMIFSCIGRRKHMGETSDEELNILCSHMGNTDRVIGASTLGEIASNETGLARLHSMSLVVTNLCL